MADKDFYQYRDRILKVNRRISEKIRNAYTVSTKGQPFNLGGARNLDGAVAKFLGVKAVETVHGDFEIHFEDECDLYAFKFKWSE